MKYTIILLVFLAVTIVSCQEEYPKESEIETSVDSIPADTTEDQRLEVIDTVKKKTVSTLYTSKCNAFKRWSES